MREGGNTAETTPGPPPGPTPASLALPIPTPARRRVARYLRPFLFGVAVPLPPPTWLMREKKNDNDARMVTLMYNSNCFRTPSPRRRGKGDTGGPATFAQDVALVLALVLVADSPVRFGPGQGYRR